MAWQVCQYNERHIIMTAAHQQMSASDEGMVSNSDCHTEMVKSINNHTTTNDDCCAQECDCLTNGCSTVSAFLCSAQITAQKVQFLVKSHRVTFYSLAKR